jgi:hypothetical protein
LRYFEVLLDPIIISALDVRFFKAWKTTYFKLRRFRQTQRQIDPTTFITNRQRYSFFLLFIKDAEADVRSFFESLLFITKSKNMTR